MLSGTLDQHNSARSDGGHREFFFWRLQKKTGPAADKAQPGESREEKGQRGGEGDGRGCCKYP